MKRVYRQGNYGDFDIIIRTYQNQYLRCSNNELFVTEILYRKGYPFKHTHASQKTYGSVEECVNQAVDFLFSNKDLEITIQISNELPQEARNHKNCRSNFFNLLAQKTVNL